MRPTATEPVRAAVPLPDQRSLHQYLIAYASEFHLLGSTLMPHAISWLTPGIKLAGLDPVIGRFVQVTRLNMTLSELLTAAGAAPDYDADHDGTAESWVAEGLLTTEPVYVDE